MQICKYQHILKTTFLHADFLNIIMPLSFHFIHMCTYLHISIFFYIDIVFICCQHWQFNHFIQRSPKGTIHRISGQRTNRKTNYFPFEYLWLSRNVLLELDVPAITTINFKGCQRTNDDGICGATWGTLKNFAPCLDGPFTAPD